MKEAVRRFIAEDESQPPEIEAVLYLLPEPFRSNIEIVEVVRVPSPRTITSYIDEDQVIEAAEGEEVPEWAFVHELIHNWYDIEPDWILISKWAEARGSGSFKQDAKEHDLSDKAEEQMVQDITSFLCGPKYARVRDETPLPEPVRKLLRAELGEPPVLATLVQGKKQAERIQE